MKPLKKKGGSEFGKYVYCSHQTNISFLEICLSMSLCSAASVVSDSLTPWTIAHQAPLLMGFSKQEYWSGLPFPSPGDLPNPGMEPMSLMSPALAGDIRFFTTSTTWEIHAYSKHDNLILKGLSV